MVYFLEKFQGCHGYMSKIENAKPIFKNSNWMRCIFWKLAQCVLTSFTCEPVSLWPTFFFYIFGNFTTQNVSSGVFLWKNINFLYVNYSFYMKFLVGTSWSVHLPESLVFCFYVSCLQYFSIIEFLWAGISYELYLFFSYKDRKTMIQI